MKTCHDCQRRLPAAAYARCNTSPDNLFMACISCVHSVVEQVWEDDTARRRRPGPGRPRNPEDTCWLPECERPIEAARLCGSHYHRRLVGNNTLKIREYGNTLGYVNARKRLMKRRGRAKDQTCVHCGEPAVKWGFKPDAVIYHENDRPYSPDPDDYEAVCKTHSK